MISPSVLSRARACGADWRRDMVLQQMAAYERRHLSEFCPEASRYTRAVDIYPVLRRWIAKEHERSMRGNPRWIPIQRARFVAAAIRERKLREARRFQRSEAAE